MDWALRVAVTNISLTSGAEADVAKEEKDENTAARAKGSAARRALKIQICMRKPSTTSSHWLPRQCMSDKDGKPFKERTIALLAGIRADETVFIAFPSACSRHSVAIDEC